jgi:meckelin
MFDPYIEDGIEFGETVLRPAPVFVKNLVRGGAYPNRNEIPEEQMVIRRFFLLDNYSSDGVIQYLTNISVLMEVLPKSHFRIKPPLFQIEYLQVRRSDVVKSAVDGIRLTEENLTVRSYTFEVIYSGSTDNFWQIVTIVFSVFIALSLVYTGFHILMHIRRFGQDSSDAATILGGFGFFFDIMGSVIFSVTFVVSIYVFIGFKFVTGSGHLFVPRREDFERLLTPMLWTIFTLKVVGTALLLFLQTRVEVFFIDWEELDDKDMSVSNWRRILVANQWARLVTRRCYNVGLTVLAVAFFLDGLQWKLLATPVPDISLVSYDHEYLILTFALTSVIWLVAIGLQWFWNEVVLAFVAGNTMWNFVNLCVSTNVSVYFRWCPFYGGYIHGRTSTSQDAQIDQQNDRVFQTYFTRDMRIELTNTINSMLAESGAPSVVGKARHLAGDMAKDSYVLAQNVNEFLRSFFERALEWEYIVQPASLFQEVLGIVPAVLEDSILTVVRRDGYREFLLGGLQWRLQLLYLVMFYCLLGVIGSAAISGLIVFVVDWFILKLFRIYTRGNLVRKTLLEDRLNT